MTSKFSFTNGKTMAALAAGLLISGGFAAAMVVSQPNTNSVKSATAQVETAADSANPQDTQATVEVPNVPNDNPTAVPATRTPLNQGTPTQQQTATPTTQETIQAPSTPKTLMSNQQIGYTNADYSCTFRETYDDGTYVDVVKKPAGGSGGSIATPCNVGPGQIR